MIKKLIIIFIIIGSLQVYDLSVLGSMIRIFHLGAVALMVAILIIDLVYFKTKSVKKNFALPIYLIFGAVFLSMFTAYFSFNQSFAISLYSQRDIYFFLFYFTLHVLAINKKDLQRIIIGFGLLYFILYLLQFFSFPNEIFDVGMRQERGTIRIYLEGSGYALFSYFMCLHIFYSTNKFKYLALSLIFLIPVFLFGARSGLLTLTMGTIVQLLFSKRINSKALIVSLSIVAMVPAFLFFQDIIDGMINATKLESVKGTDNVRILAAQYYLTQFMPNKLSIFTGIGAPSERSALGQTTTMLSGRFGYYLVDIGIIGNYVTYGIFFIIGVLIISYKIMMLKIRNELSYIKYFYFFQVFLLLPIAAGFAFSPPIVALCCIFYLVDISVFEKKIEHDG